MGTMSFAQVLEPALNWLKTDIRSVKRAPASLQLREDSQIPHQRQDLSAQRQAPKAGDIFKNPDLAAP